MVPVGLPAGGSVTRNKIQICRGDRFSPLFAGTSCSLKAAPLVAAPTLSTLKVGTPLKVIRRWKGPEGESWMQVKVESIDFTELSSSSRRGWVST